MGDRVGGGLSGVVGVILMIGQGTLHGLTTHVLAQFAILGAAVCYACAGIFGRRLRDLPGMVAATGQVTTAAPTGAAARTNHRYAMDAAAAGYSRLDCGRIGGSVLHSSELYGVLPHPCHCRANWRRCLPVGGLLGRGASRQADWRVRIRWHGRDCAWSTGN
jgi:hypothetical protein